MIRPRTAETGRPPNVSTTSSVQRTDAIENTADVTPLLGHLRNVPHQGHEIAALTCRYVIRFGRDEGDAFDWARRQLQLRKCRQTTDNPAAECIEHDSKIQEPRRGRDVCDVSDPELVRAIGREVAVDQVRGRTGIAITLCGDDAMAAADADDARCPHQPGDPLLPDCPAFGTKLRSTRGAPYVPRETAWIVRTRFNSAASAAARVDGGRERQA